jgi:hypothetical protein
MIHEKILKQKISWYCPFKIIREKNAGSKAGLVTLAEKPRQLPGKSKSDPEASRYRHLDSIKNRQTVYSPFLCSTSFPPDSGRQDCWTGCGGLLLVVQEAAGIYMGQISRNPKPHTSGTDIARGRNPKPHIRGPMGDVRGCWNETESAVCSHFQAI